MCFLQNTCENWFLLSSQGHSGWTWGFGCEDREEEWAPYLMGKIYSGLEALNNVRTGIHTISGITSNSNTLEYY